MVKFQGKFVMAINEMTFRDAFGENEHILDFITYTQSTGEFSFNEKWLNDNKMTYVAIDDNTIENYEVDFIIKNTSHAEKYYCIDLNSSHSYFQLKDDIEKAREELFGATVYSFLNYEKEWEEILSGFNNYCLYEVAIINYPNPELFIIKPWSVGYNTMIATAHDWIKEINNISVWKINDKYPIYPV